jgi:very-short-patch-repair endonuclease
MRRFVERAKQLRTHQTNAEGVLWQALRNRKLARWKFRRQHAIGRFIVDFVCLDAKLIVEVDGATHSTDAERAKDCARTQVLEACCFHVLRFWNAEISSNLNGVMETILAELEHRTVL